MNLKEILGKGEARIGRYMIRAVIPGLAIWAMALSYFPDNRPVILFTTFVGLGSFLVLFALLFLKESGPSPRPSPKGILSVRDHLWGRRRVHMITVASFFTFLFIYALLVAPRLTGNRWEQLITKIIFGFGAVALIVTTYRIKCPKCGANMYHVRLDQAEVCPYCRLELDSPTEEGRPKSH